MRSIFSGLFAKTNSVIGIDVGSASIKVIQLKKKGGKAVLETYGEIALGPYAGLVVGQATNLPGDKIREALADLMREANVTTTDGGFSVPLTSSLIMLMDMPAASEHQLAEMVPIEARKYIPVPISEVMLDWSVIPEDESQAAPAGAASAKRIRILLAAIHSSIISSYQDLATQASLTISFLEIEIFSTIRALLRRERAPVLIVDVGAGSTKIAVVENGIAVSTHVIGRGSQDMTTAISRSQSISILKAEELKRAVGLTGDAEHKDVMDTIELVSRSIFSEANKMLFAYEKRSGKTVSKVILSGGGTLLRGFVDFARKHFDAEVILADPFSQIEAPAFLEPVLKEIGPTFAVAAGIALRRLHE